MIQDVTTGHVPTRTCVGCRATAPQADLVRIALVDGEPVADPRRRLPGRGVYVHRRTDCLKAAGKGGLARALRRNVSRAQLDAIAGIAVAAGGQRPVADDASQGGANAVERAPHLSHGPDSNSPSEPSRKSHGA